MTPTTVQEQADLSAAAVPVSHEYARLAFAATMRTKNMDITPEMVKVVPCQDGGLICSAEDPEHKVNPYAWGVFHGNGNQGRVQILDYYDPDKSWWNKDPSWHQFEGEITIPPIQVKSAAKSGQEPLLDVWFDPT